MRRAFTLIELLVTIGIVIVIAAASGPALDSERQRSNLDAAVKQIRDGINQTQTYAFAPERPEAENYLFVLNYGDVTQNYNGADLAKNAYGIFWTKDNWQTVNNLRTGQIIDSNSPIKISSSSAGYNDTNNNLFKIHFRVRDGIAGCASCYYDKQDSIPACNWSNNCVYDSDYAELAVASNTQTKTIRIQKISGEIEM